MATATLSDRDVLRCTVVLPRWGVWHADVLVASGDDLEQGAACVLELAGLRLVGSVQRGGSYRERGWYRIRGGSGGWTTTIPERAYRNAAGVKLRTVLDDAARESGETLGTYTDRRIGPAFVRQRGAGVLVLDQLEPDGWYVDEAGVTQIGARPAAAYSLPFVVVDSMPATPGVVVSAESLVGLVPGAVLTVDGATIEAATVRHELTPDGLRSHVWGTGGGLDRMAGAMGRIIDARTAWAWYLGAYEYLVAAVVGGFLDLRPARAAAHLPKLANVPMGTGTPGASGEPVAGSSVVVQFLDGDPTRPRVVGYEGPSGGAHEPATAALMAAGAVEVGGTEASVAATAAATHRYVRWGEIAMGPLSLGVAFTLTPDVTNPTMSKARSG